MEPPLLLILQQALGIANRKRMDTVVGRPQPLRLLQQGVLVEDFDGLAPSSAEDSRHQLVVEPGWDHAHHAEH